MNTGKNNNNKADRQPRNVLQMADLTQLKRRGLLFGRSCLRAVHKRELYHNRWAIQHI